MLDPSAYGLQGDTSCQLAQFSTDPVVGILDSSSDLFGFAGTSLCAVRTATALTVTCSSQVANHVACLDALGLNVLANDHCDGASAVCLVCNDSYSTLVQLVLDAVKEFLVLVSGMSNSRT